MGLRNEFVAFFINLVFDADKDRVDINVKVPTILTH